MEQVPNSQDVCTGENMVDMSDWCNGWSKRPQNSWHEAEKSNLTHEHMRGGRAGREGRDGLRNREAVVRTPAVTVRVTVSLDGSKAGQGREVEAE